MKSKEKKRRFFAFADLPSNEKFFSFAKDDQVIRTANRSHFLFCEKKFSDLFDIGISTLSLPMFL